MVIEQHYEARGRGENDELRIELQCISKSAVAHKLMGEDEALAKHIKEVLRNASIDIITALKQDYQAKFPEGIK